MNNKITWEINEEVAQYIFKVLQTQPYNQVSGLLADLARQSTPQPTNTEVTVEEDTTSE